jgi:ankyrin repeat protein
MSPESIRELSNYAPLGFMVRLGESIKATSRHRDTSIDKPMNESGMTELHLGAYHQELEWVTNCINAGFDVNKPSNNGYTPLVWAIDMARTGGIGTAEKIVELLLEHGADIEHNPTSHSSILEFAKSVDPGIYRFMEDKMKRHHQRSAQKTDV